MIKSDHNFPTFQNRERLRGKQGEYEILGDFVKEGGFSAVYKALSITDNGGLVAIKAINLVNKKIKREDHIKRIKSEVEILKKLEDHPRVIKFIDCFAYEKCKEIYCIVLQWAENGDLKDYLKKQGGQLAEQEVSRIVSQIVEGILFFQKNNLVHRDFKLQNILLDREKNIKITDFGLATELSHRNDRMKTFCGTPNYIPPEMIARRGYSSQVDIWSLGVLLYHLLVGRPPTEPGENNQETMKRIQQNEIFIPELLSGYAKDIILRTLDKNPTSRITIDELIAHPFLTAHKKSRALSDISETHSLVRESNSIRNPSGIFESSSGHERRSGRDRSKSSSLIREHTPPLQYSGTPSRSKNGYTRETLDNRRRRCSSVERVPSNEIMPPPSHPNMHCGNITRDPSTGYSSSMSDSVSPKFKSKLSPRYPKPSLTSPNHHRRQSSLPSNSTELPQITLQRLVPTKSKKNKTVWSIRPDEKAYIEQLDDRSDIKYCIEVDGRSQTMIYYCPKNFRNERLPLAQTPYLPREDYSPETFYYPQIPKRHAKTWMSLYKFVQLVKSNTAKVKIFTDQGQALYMESGDFELLFYDGAKYIKNTKKEVVIDRSKKEYNLADVEVKNEDLATQIEHAKTQNNSCKLIEQAIEQIMAANSNGNFEYFPVQLGRRVKQTEIVTATRPDRPRSAPIREKSSLSVLNKDSSSNVANIVSTPSGLYRSPGSQFPTPPSSIAQHSSALTAHSSALTTASGGKKSKIVKEIHFTKFNQSSPVLYACLKSNGKFEFQSAHEYFVDNPKKQEIRVRHGNTYFYEDNGEIKGSVPNEICFILKYWLDEAKFMLANNWNRI